MIDNNLSKPNKRRRTGGFSLSEMLVAILILSLVAAGLAGGIATSIRVYRKSVQYSESQTFSNTVITAIENELRYSSEQSETGKNPAFTSSAHGSGVSIYVPESGDYSGKAVIGTDSVQTLLVSERLYPEGVTVSLEYTYAASAYTVCLTIEDAEKNTISSIEDLIIVPVNN